MKITPEDLRQVVGLQSATEEDLQTILGQGLVRSIEQDEFFFLQGDPAQYLYVLTVGQVKLLQSNPSGQQVNLRTIHTWQMFGALGVVRDAATYPVSAKAMENSAALAIRSEFLRDMIRTRSYLALDLMNLMTGYIQEIQSRYRELATERVEQRVASAILRLASEFGKRGEESTSVEMLFSREDLAEMTGTTLYTVSRLLSEWERRGIIESRRARVRILRPHELVKLSEASEKAS